MAFQLIDWLVFQLQHWWVGEAAASSVQDSSKQMKERKKSKGETTSKKTQSHKRTQRMHGNSSTARSSANVKVQFTFMSVRCHDRQIAWSHDGAIIACIALILKTKEVKLSQLYLECNILLKKKVKNLLIQDQSDVKSKWTPGWSGSRPDGKTVSCDGYREHGSTLNKLRNNFQL